MEQQIKFPFYGFQYHGHEVFKIETLDEKDAPQMFEELRGLAGAEEYISEKLNYAENKGNTRDIQFWEKELMIKENEITILQLRLRVLDLVKQIQEMDNNLSISDKIDEI